MGVPQIEPVFTYKTPITLRDADGAGVLFFARYFALAHDAYEAFMAQQGVGFAGMLREKDYICPIVHAEADYKRSLWVGDVTTINLRILEVRRRAYTISTELLTPDGELACIIKTIHVAVNKGTKRAVRLPEELVIALSPGE